jgi:hypothetical protein
MLPLPLYCWCLPIRESREQRAESREQRAESREQRAESREEWEEKKRAAERGGEG